MSVVNRKYNDDLIILKYCMSVLVVGIHSFTLSRITGFLEFFLFQGLSRLAVPCFFTISAYLYYRSVNKENYWNKTKKYIARLAKLMGIWFVVLIPYILYCHVWLPIRHSSSIGLTCFQLLTQTFVSMQINGFWYIYASILCAGLIYLFYRTNVYNVWVMWGAVASQLVCILTSTQFGLLNENIKAVILNLECYTGNLYNTTLVAVAYFILGKYIANNDKERLLCFEKRKVGLIVTLCLLSLEIYIVYVRGDYYATDTYMMLVPTTYFLFLNCLEQHIKIKSDRLRRYIGAATTVQYITQFSMFFVIQIVAKILHIEAISALAYFVLALLLSNALTGLILSLEKKHSWIRYMY